MSFALFFGEEDALNKAKTNICNVMQARGMTNLLVSWMKSALKFEIIDSAIRDCHSL